MESDNSGPPLYSTAFATLPYAAVFTVGLVFVVWGVLELVPILTTIRGDVFDLVETLAVLAFGSAVAFFGVFGAVALAVRDAVDS